jgi:acyl-[acyl-carrier-protein]-phospholipid O-acyltransferase/long-chain-fatty-acid--[acyl-carrier-protein] ligase
MLLSMLRTLGGCLLRLLYDYRAEGGSELEAPGPMLLTPNHVSWLDWLFIGLALDDSWRFVTSSTSARLSPLHRLVMIVSGEMEVCQF